MWGWLVSVLVSCSHPVTVKLCHVTLISTNTAVGIFSVHSLLFWVLGDSKKALANFFGALGSLFSSDNVHLCTMCIVSLKEWGDDSHTGWLDEWQLVGKISLPAKQSLFSKVSSTGRQHIFILLTKPSKIWYRVRGKARSAYQCFLVVIKLSHSVKSCKGWGFQDSGSFDGESTFSWGASPHFSPSVPFAGVACPISGGSFVKSKSLYYLSFRVPSGGALPFYPYS